MAATLMASRMPSVAPSAAASRMLAQGRATSRVTTPAVLLASRSGNISLAISRLAGADITLEAIRWPASTPMPT